MLRAVWRSLLTHKLRLVLSGLAIVLGVGFVVGTFIFTDTLSRTFTDLFSQTTSDVVVTPPSVVDSDFSGVVATLPDATLDTVRGVDGVDRAEGVVFVDGVAIVGSDGKPVGVPGAPLFGSNWSEDPDISPYRLVEGRGPTAAGEVAIDSVSAESGEHAVGDSVQLVTPTDQVSYEVVGIFRFGTTGNLAGATIAAFDTPTARELLLDGEEVWNEVDAVAVEGVSQEDLAARVAAALPAEVVVQTGQEAADQAAAEITEGLRFVNTFLLVFAGIALFVGTFIILNTFAMLVAQRSRELALLRAVGATRGQITRAVLAEAAVVGLIGSVLGILAGVAVAFALQGLFAAIGAEIPSDGLSVRPRTVALGLTVGVVVTLVAAFFPALRASRIPPMAALRDDVALPTRSLRLRSLLGVAGLLVGLAVMTAGVVTGAGQGSLLVGLGTVVTLLGAIVLSPALAQPIVRVLGAPYPRLFGTVGRLAVDNAERQPRRTAATASALMIGLALVSALTIFAASARDSITQVIDDAIGAEFIVFNEAQRPFPEAVGRAMTEVPEVQTVAPQKTIAGEVDGSSIFITGLDPATLTTVLQLDTTEGGWSDLDDASFALDTQSASDLGLSVGDRLSPVYGDGPQPLTLAATYESSAVVTGFIVTLDNIRASGVGAGDTGLLVKAAEGADLDAVRAGLDAVLVDYPTVTVQDQSEFKDQVSSQVNQLLAVMVLLLSLAILIAVLGIVNTLVLSVIERTREIGMLRAVGALRKQIRRMVVLESVVIAVYGAILGLVLGVGFAVALQRTLADSGINVLSIPWAALVVFLVLAALVGLLAALWPAYRAGRLDVLRAVTTE